MLEIGLQAYTGILHTEFNLIVEMQEIDDRIEKLYYDLWVPLAAFPGWRRMTRTAGISRRY